MAEPTTPTTTNPRRRTVLHGSAPKLVYVVWELTLLCDQKCNHCGSRAAKKREDELSTEEALRVVDELAELDAVEVTLIGGEAYLREDWDVIARRIVDHGMRCTMTTGAKNLTLERALRAKRAGIDAVSVSIDGLEETHDTIRGARGSFAAALRGLDHLATAGVKRTVNTQVNRLSAPELPALYELLRARGVTGWQIQLTVPMGRAVENASWLLQPYELPAIYDTLADLAKRGAVDGVVFWPANNIGYYGPYEALLRGRGESDDRAWSGCVAGKHALGLESNGTIKGCPSLPTASYAAGSVREHRLPDLWKKPPRELAFARDDEESKPELWGFCKGCYYASVCRGGCTWTSHVFFGRAGNNPYCHHRALENAARGLRERFVPIERAPGTPFDHGRFEIVVEDARAPLPKEADKPRRRLPLAG